MKYTQPLNETDQNASYINADPAQGTQGSIIPAGAIENPQREIVNVITSAGITPSDADNTQLVQALFKLIKNNSLQYEYISGDANVEITSGGNGQQVFSGFLFEEI